MTGSMTATVETLTAEVRVLMVGNRQVTLSVFKQLDSSDFQRMEPFGRVRDGREDDLYSIRLVGVSRLDGTLVRCTVPKPKWTLPAPAELNHWSEHEIYRRTGRAYGTTWNINHHPEFNGNTLQYRTNFDSDLMWCDQWDKGISKDGAFGETRDTWLWLDAEARFLSCQGHQCDLDGLRDIWELKAEMDYEKLVVAQTAYDTAKSLPLIVLAGLR